MNSIEEEATTKLVMELQREGTLEAANRLQVISDTATDKAIIKAAKKALYLLSQKKILPTTPKSKPVPSLKMQIPFRSFMTNTAGNGSFSLMFETHGPYLGSVIMYLILGNDVEGVKDYDEHEVGRRSSAYRVQEFESRYGGEGRIAISEVPFEIAFARLKQSYGINIEEEISTDSRFPIFYNSLGDPEVGFSVHPVYALLENAEKSLSEEEVASPKRFFQSILFDEWRITDEGNYFYVDLWDELSAKSGKLLEKSRLKKEATLISEAAESIFDQNLRDIYIRRLENEAYLFKIKGIHEEAEMALHHAAELKKDTPACDLPFVQEIFRRTFEPHFMSFGTGELLNGMRVVRIGGNAGNELFGE